MEGDKRIALLPHIRLKALGMSRKDFLIFMEIRGYKMSYATLCSALNNWHSVMPKVRQAIETTLDELEVKQHGR